MFDKLLLLRNRQNFQPRSDESNDKQNTQTMNACRKHYFANSVLFHKNCRDKHIIKDLNVDH